MKPLQGKESFVRILDQKVSSRCTERGLTTIDGWRCYAMEATIMTDKGAMTFPYYQGTAHKEHPTAKDLVYAVFMDAQFADQSFECWCGDLGYDSDSRKAFKTYTHCVETRQKLEKLFDLDELAVFFEDY